MVRPVTREVDAIPNSTPGVGMLLDSTRQVVLLGDQTPNTPAIASASRLRVAFSKCPYTRSPRPATLREIIES